MIEEAQSDANEILEEAQNKEKRVVTEIASDNWECTLWTIQLLQIVNSYAYPSL